MNWNAKWIIAANEMGDAAPVFKKSFNTSKPVKQAILTITAMGVYEAQLNGERVGDFVLAPGWTTYEKRLQYQQYDVTDMLCAENELYVTVGKGWYHSHMLSWETSGKIQLITESPLSLLAQLRITYSDGSEEIFGTDESWSASEGPVRFAEIYDGEIYDASITPDSNDPVAIYDGPWNTLIPQEGEKICEHERLNVARIFTTPAGETVADFGQEITGYVYLDVEAKKGDVVDLSFGEVMDKDGNFYNANYRAAKCQYHYTCRDGKQTYRPQHTFYGFRYIRINEFPGGAAAAKPENFKGICVYSDIKRTGYLSSSDPLLNQLFSNAIWSNKDNFLDVPTDCPQRNERLGWTGDAQIFARTACLNYDVEKFFTKWLHDLKADQHEDGWVGTVIPDVRNGKNCGGAAWGDVSAICPWQVYLAYGNQEILASQYDSMRMWVEFITGVTKDPYLWTGYPRHFGDWLGLDSPVGSYQGSTRLDFIASAFYLYSTEIVIKCGKILGRDVARYEDLYENILKTFRKTYPEYLTQTECVLAVKFGIAEDRQATADQLAKMIADCGMHFQTGFVGTPYLLHILSDYGYTELAYTLLLRREYPSWLYQVTKGATTIWEHWDGIMENGEFWSTDMNSFNHYAYGSVTDWVYTVACGIQTVEDAPGYAKAKIAPHPDTRLDWLSAELDTRHGHITSKWIKTDGMWRYEITTPVETEIVIDGKSQTVNPGSYLFFSPIE